LVLSHRCLIFFIYTFSYDLWWHHSISHGGHTFFTHCSSFKIYSFFFDSFYITSLYVMTDLMLSRCSLWVWHMFYFFHWHFLVCIVAQSVFHCWDMYMPSVIPKIITFNSQNTFIFCLSNRITLSTCTDNLSSSENFRRNT